MYDRISDLSSSLVYLCTFHLQKEEADSEDDEGATGKGASDEDSEESSDEDNSQVITLLVH